MKTCYVHAREWGHSWRDFMDLPIPFWWYEFDGKVRQGKKVSERSKGGAAFDAAAWRRAREEHRRKMNGY